jgi:hypothetical protein
VRDRDAHLVGHRIEHRRERRGSAHVDGGGLERIRAGRVGVGDRRLDVLRIGHPERLGRAAGSDRGGVGSVLRGGERERCREPERQHQTRGGGEPAAPERRHESPRGPA